ncbi:MAG: hypothetical protein KDJ19_10890 [Hyphomicrobiaceae bacterium]|nr:hypothetical protein [Hyphomicrobiaceae bacterium]MCC0025044.1 hypothetical protein [Hyphomicrobiaceae bacterium]
MAPSAYGFANFLYWPFVGTLGLTLGRPLTNRIVIRAIRVSLSATHSELLKKTRP